MSGGGELRLRAEGRLSALDGPTRRALLERGRSVDAEVSRAVAELIEEVRAGGEAALRAQARRFDPAEPASLEVPRAQWERALASLEPAVRAALEQAAANVAAFHRAQLPAPLEVEVSPGVRLGRRADPLRRVGAYVPGGRASYPSSVLMCVVPARVAGVDQVVVCSPPGPDGLPAASVLAACALAGADRVFALGGAGAIAAMALGAGGVPRVDKVVGPGNAYVSEAKRQLTGLVAIDSPAGPSEILIVADGSADPDLVAAELIAQAEHDPDAAAVLVATDASLPERVRAALARRLPEEPRRAIVAAALADAGALLVATSAAEAMAFAEEYAPEHLLLLVDEPRALLPRVRSAGTVFLGRASSVAFGDYMTGANHTLPTGTLARSYSGLSTLDFIRWTTYQEVAPAAAAALAGPTAALAEAEG
ncbi:MAG TPA: histidinol dehydrogenase, partial [Longimicrobiales bacterium]|nr:histidinol dehydrogenase [Longimicrobiales bacterium]